MRTLLLASTALTLAACSDNTQPTAPHSIGSATTGAGAATASHALTQAAGKPVDQVGFTKTVVVSSPTKTVLAGSVSNAYVSCPSGTALVGGGYNVLPGPYATTWPVVTASTPHIELTNYDGWAVIVRNTQPGSDNATFHVFVICAS